MTFDTVEHPPAGADATEPVTGDELEALALAADPAAPLDPEAVPSEWFLGAEGPSLLPDWYLGHATRVRASRWRGPVVVALVATFVVIDALGLCSAYGWISLA